MEARALRLSLSDKKAVSTALKMLSRESYSMEEIAELNGLPLEEVQELSKKQTA